MTLDLTTLPRPTIPFKLAVAMGMFPGMSFLDKYGSVRDMTQTNGGMIWKGGAAGGDYPWPLPGAADITHVVSTSSADAGKPVDINGLLPTGYEDDQVVLLDALDGTTPAPLTRPLYRSSRQQNDGAVDFVGDITLTNAAGDKVYSFIGSSNGFHDNQTQNAFHTIPLGYVGFLFRGEIGMSKTSGSLTGNEYASLCYRSRRVGKVFKNKKIAGLSLNGDSNYMDVREFADPIPALTDVCLHCFGLSETGQLGFFGTFDLLLVEEQILGAEYLEKLGQPTEMPEV